MVSVRSAVPLEVRARAAVVLERDGAGATLDTWRDDVDLVEVRWASGGRAVTLRDALERMTRDFMRSGDPAAGLALVWLAQALVLARLDEGPEARP